MPLIVEPVESLLHSSSLNWAPSVAGSGASATGNVNGFENERTGVYQSQVTKFADKIVEHPHREVYRVAVVKGLKGGREWIGEGVEEVAGQG